MLFITYQNNIGKLDFGGGDSSRNFKILDVEGLSLPTKNLNVVSYPGEVGQRTISESAGPRTITLQCDLHSPNGNRYELSKALKILEKSGTLVIRSGNSTRKISARCIDAAPGERYGGYRVLILQFMCDYPYFEDKEDTNVHIFRRENKIKTTFTLPDILSKRVSEATVTNLGDTDTEPTIIITMLDDTVDGNLAIKISNVFREGDVQTKQSLDLCFPIDIVTKDASGNNQTTAYTPSKGEIITLDIQSRKIFNQNGDNLISCLSNTSFLSDFWLSGGSNEVAVDLVPFTSSCTVVYKFSNKYVEAVIA